MVVHTGTGIKLKSSSRKHLSTQAQKARRVKDVKPLKRVNVRSFIESSKGKILSVTFAKLDGSVRKLVGRIGVHSYLNGGENKVERDDRPYITLFDLQKAQYRAVNLDTISEIRAKGCIWTVM